MKNARARTRFVGMAAAVLVGLCMSVASADPTPEDKATARTLWTEGRQQMVDKQYEAALKSFRAAHAIMGAPSTGVDLARAQEALGMLLEARETALAVTKIPVEAGESAVFAKARTAAEELATKLGPKIPSLLVVVSGLPAGVEPVVTVNGATIPGAAVGLPRKLNPGKHVLEVTVAGFSSVKRDVELRESQARTETIRLEPVPAGATTGTTGATTGTPEPSGGPGVVPSVSGSPLLGPSGTAEKGAAEGKGAPPGDRGGGEPSRPRPVWAWVAGGAGLVAAGVSIGFLSDHLAARAVVDKDCPGGVCNWADFTEQSMIAIRARWNRDLGISVGLGAFALVGLTVGIIGIVKAPGKPEAKTSVTVAPWAGASSGGVTLTGAF